jgi:phosphoglycolate phosphatase
MKDMTDKPVISLLCCGLIGSLVTDGGLIERSFAEAIATQGVVSGTSAFAQRMAQVYQARGRGAGDVLAALFPDNEARAQAAHLAFDRAVADALGRVVLEPVPGAIAVLDHLRATGCRVCVVTSLPRRALDLVLAPAGLLPHIDLALSAEDVSRGFPAPDLVLTALMRTRTGAVAEVAVVHGTGAGVESGRRSGAGIVAGVLTGPHAAARLRAAGAAHVLGSIADLPGLLLAPPASAIPAARAEPAIPAQVPSGRRTLGL